MTRWLRWSVSLRHPIRKAYRWVRLHVPRRLLPDLRREDLEEHSFYTLLQERHGVQGRVLVALDPAQSGIHGNRLTPVSLRVDDHDTVLRDSL